MLYLSHTNDGAELRPRVDEPLVLAVVLNDTVLGNIKQIALTCRSLQFPYGAQYEFRFPTDNVRLLEVAEIDELLIDRKKYESWEMNGEDPLDYYRFILHPYEPKEDFWRYALKPDSVTLGHSAPSSFGFDARYGSKTYYGYQFDWAPHLEMLR